ncbi:MAG TPA: ABC transporter substrate-binding protein [Trichocoleus sp.]
MISAVLSRFQIFSRLRQRGRRGVAIVLMLLMAIGVVSCSETQLRSQASRVPQLVFASPSDPATFNYALNSSAYSVFGLIYVGLLSTNGITGDLEPELAESWEVSPDKKRIVFTLREGLKWSDGHPLTAEDVEFSYNQVYLNEKVAVGLRDILQIGDTGQFPTVRKLDDRRVEFLVPEPFAPFLRYSGGIGIMPAHVLRKTVETTDQNGKLAFLDTWGTDTDPRQVVVNGPYKMERYVAGERVIFVQNPYYWRRDAAGNQQPYIERIVQQVIGSDDAQMMSFRSGDLDEISVKPEQFQLLKSEEKRGKYTIYNGGSESGSRFVSFNLTKAKDQKGRPFVDPIKSRWFNNLAFRQAVAYALDRERMKNTIYQGLGELQNSPLDSQNPFFAPPEAGVKAYDYRPEQSKKLLQEAGFKYDNAGKLFDSEGNRVQFVLLVKSEELSRVRVATQIKQDLEAIGIQVDLQVISFNLVIQKLKQRTWECYVGGFLGGGLEPQSGFNIWSTRGSMHQFNQGPFPGEPPIQGWEVSDWEREIDQLFTAGVKELDKSKRQEIYKRFQQIAQEQVPFIHLVNPLSLNAVRDRVQNIQFTALGGAFWNLYELKVLD